MGYLIYCRFAKEENSSTEEIRNLQQSAARIPVPDSHPDKVRGHTPSGDMLSRPANIQESHGSNTLCVCSCQLQDTQSSMPYVSCTCSSTAGAQVLSNSCNPSQHLRKDCTAGCSIEDSFTSLRVSSTLSLPHTNCASASGVQSMVVMRSCREQAAAACINGFDDTTVDDLAGYLDEIMFIPKPMSEMAELMYTWLAALEWMIGAFL